MSGVFTPEDMEKKAEEMFQEVGRMFFSPEGKFSPTSNPAGINRAGEHDVNQSGSAKNKSTGSGSEKASEELTSTGELPSENYKFLQQPSDLLPKLMVNDQRRNRINRFQHYP